METPDLFAERNGIERCKRQRRTAGHKMPAIAKKPVRDRSRLLFGIAVGLLAMSFVAGNAKPAAAQSADAEARCTGDVMRLCSEFVPDADSIVVCLKAKRHQLGMSCLNALSPAPPESLALPASPKKKVRKARAPLVLTATARSTNVRHRKTVAR